MLLTIHYHTHFNNLLFFQQNKLFIESGKEKGMSVMIFPTRKNPKGNGMSYMCFQLHALL